jgi:hypothetical protein
LGTELEKRIADSPLQVGSDTWLDAFKLCEQLLSESLLQLAAFFAVNVVAVPFQQSV